MQTHDNPTRVHINSREYQFHAHDGDAIDITRSGKYGNPFVIGRDGDRETVIAKFYDWLKSDPKAAFFRADIRKGVFANKFLGCACKSGLACHGDVIVELHAKHARHSDRQVTKRVAKQAVSRRAWIAQSVDENRAKLPEGDGQFRVVVAGSRGFSDKKLMHARLSHFLKSKLTEGNVTIISGGANGADKLGERWGAKFAHNVHRIDAPWDTFGNSAGHIRNEVMAQVADACVVFWDGKSSGTKGMIDQAEAAGIPVRVVRY